MLIRKRFMSSLTNIYTSGGQKDPNFGRLLLFFRASRNLPVPHLYQYLQRAANENVVDTFSLVFNLRDCRGGKGERALGIRSLQWLFLSYPKKFMKVVGFIPEYGRWDDLIHFWPRVLNLQNSISEPTPKQQQQWLEYLNKNFCVNIKDQKSLEELQNAQLRIVLLFGQQLAKDLAAMKNSNKPSLCAKWAPTENDSLDREHKTVKQLCSIMQISRPQYRKCYTSPLREYLRVTETLMCRKEWNNIDFGSVPFRAMKNLVKAFERHVPHALHEWRSKTTQQCANHRYLLPHEIICNVVTKATPDYVCQRQWRTLEDQIRASNIFSDTLAVVDTSISMKDWGKPKNDRFPFSPMDVALGMGILISNCSTMKNHVINFSNNPVLMKLISNDIYTRCQELRNSEWAGTLNFNDVFDLILKYNKKYNFIPKKLLVLTDMSFTSAGGSSTDFEAIDIKFDRLGIKKPLIIFWNLTTDNEDLIVKTHKSGVILISGFYPSMVSAILKGESPDPVSIMKRTLGQNRYSAIHRFLR